MFAGFQSNAYQGNAYQIGNGGYTPANPLHGGGLPFEHYDNYRKKLERSIKAADRHNASKYIKQAVAAAEVIESIEGVAPEIKKVAIAVKTQQVPQIDFTRLQAELLRIAQYMDNVILMKQQEAEEEMILLMII